MMNQVSNSPSMNQPCPCGSGKKYKRCCGAANQARKSGLQVQSASATGKLVEEAIRFHQQGQPAQAARLLDVALSKLPNDPALLGMRGMMDCELNKPESAEAYVRRALELNPNDPRLYNFMGQVQVALDNNVAAERAFGKAVTLEPAFFEAWCNLGQIQLLARNPEDARATFRKALALAPHDGALHMSLAEAAFLSRHLAEAEAAIRAAGRFGAPGAYVDAWLALVSRAHGRGGEADQIEATALAAMNAEDRYALALKFGHLQAHVGAIDEATRWFRLAIELNPNRTDGYAELAQVYKFAEADRPLVEKMEHLLNAGSGDKNRALEFALGKVCTDIGEYDRSFEHYRKGNDIVRASVSFDAAAYVAEIDELVEFFSKDRLQSLPKGSDSDMPILIVGTPRSGTTLTEQIISSHSAVAGAGEMDFWPRLGKLLQKNYTEKLAAEMAESYLGHLRQHSTQAIHVTDKMPGNYRHLGLIHAVFPNAKIIHTKRHPIDACLSIYFQNFNDGHAYKWDLDGLAVFYEQYQRLMAHWRSILPAGILYESQYEELVEGVEGESRKIMTFLGLEWEPGQLDFYKQDRAVFTASKWQARQPIYKSSKERWRRYEKHLGPLQGLLKYAPEAK